MRERTPPAPAPLASDAAIADQARRWAFDLDPADGHTLAAFLARVNAEIGHVVAMPEHAPSWPEWQGLLQHIVSLASDAQIAAAIRRWTA